LREKLSAKVYYTLNSVMIDNLLIENNSKSINNSFVDSKQISKHLYELNNVLTVDALDKLKEYVKGECNWQEQEYYIPEDKPILRSKITWDQDTVIEEIHTAIENNTHEIEKKFNLNLRFMGVTLWKDEAGHDLVWHTDNPMISVTMQIYLFGENSPGTVFKVNNTEHTCLFSENNGYLVNQSTDERPVHKLEFEVKSTRYSLFAMWELANQ